MQKSILIMKTGNTIPPLRERGEDFEDWFVAGSGRPASEFTVRSLFLGEPLPDLADTAGIIITGSPAYVTDLEPWNTIAAAYLRDAFAREVPILGVCYGHQLLAWAFEGDVGFHPDGREIGSVSVQLTDAGKADSLLGSLPADFVAQVSHQQSVLRLPPEATLLAHNDFDPHHGFRLGDYAWGVQFHPEFDAAITRAYIQERQDDLLDEGLPVQQLLNAVRPSPESASLLRSFCDLAIRKSAS